MNRTKEQSCQALADCPARRGGRSALATRTVRPGAAEIPARCRGQSGQEPQTVRKSQQNHQRRTRKNGLSARTGRTVRTGSGPSANRLQQKASTKPDRKRRHARTRRTCEEHSTRGLSARHTRTVRASRTEAKTTRPHRSTPPTHHRISQAVEAVEKRVWEQEKRQTRMLYPKNLAS
jgi:hypothetical protein